MVRLRKGKTTRWRKGQSCESNPAIKVHREAVKRGTIVGHATRNSNLTVEALARHAEKHDEDGDVELKDDEGVSMKSGQTFGAFRVSGLAQNSRTRERSFREKKKIKQTNRHLSAEKYGGT